MCPGDPLPTRDFGVDLDDVTPLLRPVPKRVIGGTGFAAPTTFPYRVRRGEPAVFSIVLSTTDRDCSFALVVDWVANGEQKSTTTGDFRIVPR